jgi:inosose dehydratase
MPNIKWAMMDHWSMVTPRGPISPWSSRKYMDRFVKQAVALGITGYDTFIFRLRTMERIFGSPRKFLEFIQDRGMEKIVGLWPQGDGASHIRSTHDAYVRSIERALKDIDGLGVELFIVMPVNAYWQTVPITDEKIKAAADLYNRVGKLTLERGIKLSCHHEFWGGIESADAVEKFYNWTDPQCVFFYCDTAQHLIAGVDPLKLYLKYHDRCSGLHFKDTHTIDTKGERLLPPDPECIAPSEPRWFWEIGTPEGKVDFVSIMKALKEYNYKGWLTFEHDKADVAGGDYASSTCIAKWYVDNVLSKIYA